MLCVYQGNKDHLELRLSVLNLHLLLHTQGRYITQSKTSEGSLTIMNEQTALVVHS